MGKQSKTDRVIEAMREHKTITIGEIREATSIPAHEIGGILASLERQERVKRAEVEDAKRNHWCLLRAEKRPRSTIDSGLLPLAVRRRMEDREREEKANQSAVMLQNIVIGMAHRAALRNASYA